MLSSEDIIQLARSAHNSKMLSAPELLELEEEGIIPMEYSEGGQKGKTPTNTILELGKTLLQAAREGDTMSVIDLMSKGAPFTTDWLGTSPLHLAAMNNHLDTCETLLRAGIGKDAKTKVERSPLHFAAYEGHTPIVQVLLKHSVEVDSRDMLHMTPLHWAVERQHEECAILLIQAGADPMAMSRFHKTPLSIAEELGWDSMWGMLQSAHLQRSRESISNTAQAVEGISDGICLPTEDIIISPDVPETLEEQGHAIEDHESEPQEHIENILPRLTHSSNEAALQMLREHGIMMLPNDNTNTVTSAVQSGRKIVLSDAGKLMLKDISESPKVVKKEGLTGKTTNAKIYTMSSSQFLALTGQNKNNTTLRKIAINKPLDNNTNVNKLKTLPVLKAININKTPTKLLGDNKIISPYKGKIISINSIAKLQSNLSDELVNVKTLAGQGKTKIIQLKNASNFGKTVKIVVKNTGNNQIDPKFLVPKKITTTNTTSIPSSTNSTTSLNMPALTDIESHNIVETPSKKDLDEVETLKKQLAETREELETYKKKFQLLEDELNVLRNSQDMIHTQHGEPELVTQIVETGYDSTEIEGAEFVDTQEIVYKNLENEPVIDTTIVESDMESG